MVLRTQFPDFREFKRRRLDIDEPRTPTKVQGDDSEMPQTPLSSQVAPEKRTLCISTLGTSCVPSSTGTPLRLRRRDLIPAMQRALQPFTRYMIDLAEGKLDKYFDSTQLEPWGTHLGVTLPSGPLLLLHDLGNYPDDARLPRIFKSETVFVSL